MSESKTRREFLTTATMIGAGATLAPLGAGATGLSGIESARRSEPLDELTAAVLEQAEKVIGVQFTEAQREMMLEDLGGLLETYETLRGQPLDNGVMPAQVFDPAIGGTGPRPVEAGEFSWEPAEVGRPASDEDLAFAPVAVLSSLLRSRQVRSTELTELYLSRLRRYEGVLECVVTLTEERALAQAQAADAELDAGLWRGPLHGVPWGAKDLLAVRGYPTTWGAMPYREQVLDLNAAVVERLDQAGAVLVAKLTLGALAWGDVWFDGVTRNPWNVEQGASGSSAGSGSATAAGLVGFAIGSETLGSIVSPSTRNGVTGLRPTFGRVSRHGAMTLSWSMDKLGPMCRSAEDCALVFEAIHGRDPRDPCTVDSAFSWPGREPGRWRVGYAAAEFEGDHGSAEADRAVLDVLRAQGFDLVPVTLPETPAPTGPILSAEAAAAFDALTRSGGVDTMVRQVRNAWPNTFRYARFIPAVEYVNANRVRTLLMREMDALMQELDVVVVPSFRGGVLGITNLTGHPCVVVPNRFDPLEDSPDSPRRSPGSISFIGGLYQDEAALAVARAYQSATDFHRRRPPIR